ncbi:MAG: LptF/LptG family permease [Anaerohalosphaera sp.]|nr:LptF/LptG family permease [Anaerohalosphaera sp.]
MVFTLHRYIFRELIKVFILSSAAMTLMLSTVMMLRPIQKYGVGPDQALHLYGYFLPITLTFVLPIGAIFAAALIYGRFASDNELDACRASGVSLMTLIYPGLCLAITVAITSLILSFYVVPAFVQRAEMSIKANAKQMLFRNLQRKGFCELERGFIIYADNAIPSENLLEGTIVIRTKKTSPDMMITTDKTLVQIEGTANHNKVTVVATDYNRIDEYGQQSHHGVLPIETSFPPLLSDDINFQKIDRIKEIKSDMMKFKPVKDLAMDARAQLITEMLAREMNLKFEKGIDEFYPLTNDIMKFMFTAKGCKPLDNWKIELVGPIKLFEVDKVLDDLICTYQCQSAFIELNNNTADAKLEMILQSPTWDKGKGIKGVAAKKVIRSIAIPASVINSINDDNLLADLKTVLKKTDLTPTPKLVEKLERLDYKIWQTNKYILAAVHSRLVFGLGCISIVLISIALGIKFRGGHLLSAFGASAIPAGILVVFMMSGKQLTTTKNESMPEITGIIVMWAGLVLLSVAALWIYRKMLKT